MFKGIDEQTKKEFEKCNSQSSKHLVFSFADLELCRKYKKNGQKREKCRLLSDELSSKLHQIYSEGKSGYTPPIKFIDFELERKSDLFFPKCDSHFFNYGWWLELNKKGIRENSEVFSDGTLKFNFVVSGGLLNYDNKNLGVEKKKEKFCQQKARQSSQARTSALDQIKNTIKEGNIDFTTLKESMLFLRESYLQAWPDDCLHCPKKYAKKPENVAKYHKTHINKCLWRPDRINEFKDSQIALIERIIAKFNNYKNQVIQQIIQKANNQGISETQLNSTRPGWQENLRKLTNRQQIADYQKEHLEKDIESLVAAKNKTDEERQQAEEETKKKAQQEEERLKKEREEKEAEEKKKREQETKKQAEEQAKQQKLNQKRTKFITEITTALNHEPQLTNDDLSPQYQNWEEQINQLTDIQQITNLQDRLLADIQARRQDKKTAQEVKENLHKAQTGTKEEKEEAWKNLEKQETEKGYNDNKEEVEKLKKEKANENPQEYSEEAKKRIEEKLRINGIKENELSNENQQEWQKLKNGEIKDPEKLVATETKIKQNIYQKEAEKKVVELTSQVNKVLKSKDKSQIIALKKMLLEFISSGNIYYSSQKKTVENLLTQLENYLNNNNQSNSAAKPNNFPWKVVIPCLLIGSLLTGLVIFKKRIIKRRKSTH
jgi:hypothetical protein